MLARYMVHAGPNPMWGTWLQQLPMLYSHVHDVSELVKLVLVPEALLLPPVTLSAEDQQWARLQEW